MKYYQLKEYPIEFVLTQKEEKYYTLHNHMDHYVIGLVLEGEVILREEGKEERTCHKEELFAIPYLVVHELEIKKETRLLSLCIGIDLFETCSLEELNELIWKCTKKLIDKQVINEAYKEAFLETVEMIYKLHKMKNDKLNQDIKKVVSVIKDAPESEITLENLAKQIYISKYYLIRKFKKSVGLTPHQFQIQNKVRHSQNLIEKGEELIEISNQMGFYDQSHFNKSFNKIVGLTPREYKDSVESIDFIQS